MRSVLLTYGLFAGFGIFAIAGWITAAVLSEGSVPGGANADPAVTAPLAIASLALAAHCFGCLRRESGGNA